MNKKAVVTGASKGIGWAVAARLAKEGFDLALCARNGQDLEAARQKLLLINPRIEVMVQATDVRVKEQVLHFAQLVLEKWQSLDILVNNAGVYVGGEISQEGDGILEQLIETNLYSAYHLTRALLPTMLAQGSGHIFNMCSIASKIAYPNGGSYSISKFALLGFSKVLREEMKGKGIRVTSILPGATWSDSWAGVELPESRLMQADDIAIALWSAYQMSSSAVVEEIVLRPQLGDL